MNQKKGDLPEISTDVKVKELKSEKEIALDFAIKVHKKFDRLIKASVLFGSQAKGLETSSSDIDIIFIIDDASVIWDIELVAWYREELSKLISQSEYEKELHINSIKLTTWWQDLLNGEAVVINIIRYGEPLLDTGGFFNPLKALLVQGKIRSTPEAVYSSLQRAPMHLARSKSSELNAIEGVYWCIIDSAQAALITAGKIPASPEQIPELLKLTFVDSGMLKIDAIRLVRDIHTLHKKIVHGEIRNLKGAEIDLWQEHAESFLSKMNEIISKMLQSA